MTREQEMVRAFHQAVGQTRAPVPTPATLDDRDLRIALLSEEGGEVEEALYVGDLAGIAHELADLLYVVYGTAVTYGIDLEPVFAEVDRANMSKVDGHRRADGKWLKGTYRPAVIPPILEAQGAGQEGR